MIDSSVGAGVGVGRVLGPILLLFLLLLLRRDRGVGVIGGRSGCFMVGGILATPAFICWRLFRLWTKKKQSSFLDKDVTK